MIKIISILDPAHTVTNTYEPNRDVLLTKLNQRASDNATISSVNYSVNSIGQRTNATRSGAATNSTTWGYDSLGQVTSADDSNNTADRSYQYDGIGNRLTSSSPSGASPASAGYTPNALNQYDTINTFVPTYDDDGNQINAQIHPQSPTSSPASLSPVSCVFSWDSENRLIEVKDSGNNSLVKHHYDSQSRKIATITPTEITLYIYNGWNSIAEYRLHNSSFNLHTSLLWGLDLSGGEQGAGGVGGLLMLSEISNSQILNFIPCYDGNGNVTEYINSSEAVVAHYEYDAFGNTTIADGTKANDFTYRYSTKPIDSATGILYYGYRFHDPATGRWPSRDPIEENGGHNIYGFLVNNAISRYDVIGLAWSRPISLAALQATHMDKDGWIRLHSKGIKLTIIRRTNRKIFGFNHNLSKLQQTSHHTLISAWECDQDTGEPVLLDVPTKQPSGRDNWANSANTLSQQYTIKASGPNGEMTSKYAEVVNYGMFASGDSGSMYSMMGSSAGIASGVNPDPRVAVVATLLAVLGNWLDEQSEKAAVLEGNSIVTCSCKTIEKKKRWVMNLKNIEIRAEKGLFWEGFGSSGIGSFFAGYENGFPVYKDRFYLNEGSDRVQSLLFE